MTINGTNGVSAGMPAGASGMPQGVDPMSKDIQNQISRLQKQLQELSANTEMGAEAKMKKRQEIQKQINELNVQLRQHQIEMRKKEQEEKASFDDMLGGEPKGGKKGEKGQTGVSLANMEAMISADAAMEQAKVHGSVASRNEGRAGVLKAEIALDAGRGGSSNVELKEAELADVEKKAMDATSSQMGMLAKANEVMEEASKEDKTDAKETDKTSDSKEASKAAGSDDEAETAIENGEAAEVSGNVQSAETEAREIYYTRVDVRL